VWANQIAENGLDGVLAGTKMSKAQKLIISKNMKGSVSCYDISTGESLSVQKEEFDMRSDLVGVCKNRKLTKEHKAKISGEGRVHSDETKNKIGNAHRGKVVSEETKEKLRSHKRTSEQKKRCSDGAKNRKQIECPHCSKVGHPNNMKRWHFDNCKLNLNKS